MKTDTLRSSESARVALKHSNSCTFHKKDSSHYWLESFLLVAGTGFEPMTFRLCIPTMAFATRRQIKNLSLICGLDYPFTLSGIRLLVSTPSPTNFFKFVFVWLGITMLKASPNLTDVNQIVSNLGAHFEPDELPDCSTPRYVVKTNL